MKKTVKKLICALLVITVLFSSTIAFASYGEGSVNVIEELGIAKTVKFPYFHTNYNRAEFAYMLSVLDVEYIPGRYNTVTLPDVKDENAEYATYAVSKGYLALDKDGNFNPNAKVTYNEAVEALVKLLGYDFIAENDGGTAAAYASVAKKIKLTSGVPASNDVLISKDGLASMVINALHTPHATLEYESGAEEEGTTILEQKNISMVEAKLLATSTRGINADVCEEGYINLGGTLIKTDKTFSDSLVGRMVHCYIQENRGQKKVVSIADVSGETLILEALDIYDVNVTKKQVSFKYGDGKKVNIPHNATIIINGKPGDLTKEVFDVFTSGTMEIFDSDDNGSFDTVDMALCVTEVVESASFSGNSINTKYTKRHIDFDDSGSAFSIYENEMPVGMSAIKADSVVNIACDAYNISEGTLSFDYSKAKFIRVYVSSHKLTGTLESMSDTEYLIDGRSFVPNSVLDTISELNVKIPLDLGSTYKFSIDAFGSVSDYELMDDSADFQYGYLMDAGIISDAFESAMKVQILNNNSELVVYDVKDRYILDGDREVIDGGYTLPSVLEGRQLIRYKCTGNVVSAIDTINMGSKEIAETSLSLDYDAKTNGLRYWGDFNGFEDHRTVVSSDTKVFFVTDDATADETAFKAEKPGIFESSSRYNYQSYDIGEVGKTGCILVYSDISEDISFMTRAYMLEKVSRTLNDNGDDVIRLYVHGYAGSVAKDILDEKELIFTDLTGAPVSSVANLKKGDIVRFVENASGKIVKLERAFTLDKEPEMSVSDLIAGGLHYEYGMFYDTNSTHFVAVGKEDLTDVSEDEKFVFAYKYPARVPVYNMRDNTITLYVTDFQEIPTYLNSAEKVTVFIHMGTYALYSVAVYIWE